MIVSKPENRLPHSGPYQRVLVVSRTRGSVALSLALGLVIRRHLHVYTALEYKPYRDPDTRSFTFEVRLTFRVRDGFDTCL